MRAIDTNVLVRLLTRDDLHQADAAETFIVKSAWVSHLALAETSWVLSSVYQREPSAIADAVEMLLNHEHLTLQDPETVTAAIAQFRARPKVGFSDCLMLAVARKAGHVPLGTFDKDLGKLDDVQRL